MTARPLLATLAGLALATPSFAQHPAATRTSALSVETIYGSAELSPKFVRIRWLDEGRAYTLVERDARARTNLVKVDVASGQRETLLRDTDLIPAGEDLPIRIQSYRFSEDGSKLLIGTRLVPIWRHSFKGHYYVWDFEALTLTPISRQPGDQRYAKLSPDGRHVAFVRDNNLHLTDLASGAERALTADGSEDVINGASDWVYEEELVLYDAFRWSPDSKRIAFWRFDQSPIRPFYLVDETKLYPELVPIRYPKAGTPNSEVRLGVVEIAGGATNWIDIGPTDEDFYIARMDFSGAPNEIWFQRLNRHQSRMDLYLADVRSGRSRLVMTDSDEAWLDLYEPSWPHKGEPIWIEGGKKFVYLSERDGFAHLYLFDRDGSLLRRLTEGDWEVISAYGVDERRKLVYFTGTLEGPLRRPLYRVGLSGRGLRRVSQPRGTHNVSFDPSFTYYFDTHSEAGVPPAQTLRRANGTLIRVLEDNAALRAKLQALDLRRPDFLSIPTGDGLELNAYLIKPADFDPARRYPLLMYVYGGPGSQTVTDEWWGDRYLWHQMLAQQGYLVVSVDNRGTGARGARFKKLTYLNLGRYEVEDQIAAARHFAGLPYIDGERIGIWGWSYGGYMTALSLFKGNDVFKAGIAVAPVTDWRLYDTIYTERYMRTPEENPRGYAEGAPLAYADRLQGAFLLVHGTGDDNVHAQNSTLLVTQLERANKQFDLRLYPNHAHGIRGPGSRVNLFTLMTEFLRENL